MTKYNYIVATGMVFVIAAGIFVDLKAFGVASASAICAVIALVGSELSREK